MRWPMLKPCVTEESAISVTLEMLARVGRAHEKRLPIRNARGR